MEIAVYSYGKAYTSGMILKIRVTLKEDGGNGVHSCVVKDML